MTEEKNEKTNKPTIQQSSTSFTPQPPTFNLKTKPSSSTSTLLSADYNYNPTHNPKKDELVQTASIRILEVESLLDKLNTHINKHHRKSSQELQNFEQIHTELSKIQSTLISDDKSAQKHYNKPSQIDPFIIIATNNNSDNESDEKDDEKYDTINSPISTIHNNTLPTLEPFQSLVSKMQQNIDPNHKISFQKRSSIKIKTSELDSIHIFVNEHRHKMKEKTYQYEEKKKQLFSAKQRLNKAKMRFKKRLKTSKQKSNRRYRNRDRAHSDNKRKKYNKKHKKKAVSDITSRFHVINENSDVDMDVLDVKTSVSALAKLSHANLNKLNHDNGHGLQVSAPIFLGGGQHGRGGTQSSVGSAFSTISDQSFVDDFHSITAELENIDDIVRKQVKSPSMTSIFSDLGTPKVSPRQSPRQSGDDGAGSGGDYYVKNNISCLSGESESNNTKNIQSYCSSITTSSIGDSLQSDIYHLQDIEHQIGDL